MTTSLARMQAELSAVMTGPTPGLSTADHLCHTCVSVLGVDGAAISMVFDGASTGTYGSSGEASRRLDEYQFTFGEGPCLDAAASGGVVHAPDLESAHEHRWPIFAEAVLGDGIRAVFALPIRLASDCVGALDLYRVNAGPLTSDQLTGGLLAAELATLPLLTLIREMRDDGSATADTRDGATATFSVEETRLVEMDRIEVYQATGMLIAQLDVSADEALARLRAHALATGQTASEVAYAILQQGLEMEPDEHDSQEGPGA